MVTFFNPIFLVVGVFVVLVVGAAALAVVLGYGVLFRHTVRVLRDPTLTDGDEWPRDRVTVVVCAASSLSLLLAAWAWTAIRDEMLLAAGFPLAGVVIAAGLLVRRSRRPARVGMIVCCVAMLGPLWFPLLMHVLMHEVVRSAGGVGRLAGWPSAPAVLAGVVAVVLVPLLWLGTRSAAVVGVTIVSAAAGWALWAVSAEWRVFGHPLALATAPMLVGPAGAVVVQTVVSGVPARR